MYQYETITTKLCGLPIQLSEIADMKLVFHTLTKKLLEKSGEEFEIQEIVNGEDTCTVVKVRLTQEESGKLTPGPVLRSFIIVAQDGTRMESRAEDLFVLPSGEDGVIADEP